MVSHCIPQVKIIVVDSITFHFRQDFDDLALRTRVLGGMSLKLMRFAKKYSLAVSNYSLFPVWEKYYTFYSNVCSHISKLVTGATLRIYDFDLDIRCKVIKNDAIEVINQGPSGRVIIHDLSDWNCWYYILCRHLVPYITRVISRWGLFSTFNQFSY